jgi:hypothetical protein
VVVMPGGGSYNGAPRFRSPIVGERLPLNASIKQVMRRRRIPTVSPILSAALLAAALIASLFQPNNGLSSSTVSAFRGGPSERQFDCGYDPQGAADELSNHTLNVLRRSHRDKGGTVASTVRAAGPSFKDVGDITVVEDDGSVVIPPNKFTLKNSSILFTPDGEGYRISPSDLEFDGDFGSRLFSFFGADGKLIGDADNGYRDISIPNAQFPFFGAFYDTLYVGTNGYITFTQGDTTARISPSALATELPRIAPLWADLDVTDSGGIYYNRLSDRHVITWNRAAQPLYSGISTFQAVLYDDGRIAFVYGKVKAQAALVGISPGHYEAGPQPVDYSNPPASSLAGPLFETFAKQKRLDLPALLRTFYLAHSDSFDAVYVWTDFAFDNGLGIAREFNVRNDTSGVGLRFFDRGSAYGSRARLSSIITVGNQADWPKDPQAHVAGLNSAISIVCHELGHRWLVYVHFVADGQVRDDLLGRDSSHWSFLADTRTAADGSFSSLMEGNAWRNSGGGTFTTIESAVNYFTPLDQYLMGLRRAEDVGEISYLVADPQLKDLLHEKSPFSGFSMTAASKTTSVAQIVACEGPRIPDATTAPKHFGIAFVLLSEQGSTPSNSVLDKISGYRDSLVRYFSAATGGRGSLDASLKQ